jgi:uncharacterized BrkB/YihY/UPF0761 family membrane protein
MPVSLSSQTWRTRITNALRSVKSQPLAISKAVSHRWTTAGNAREIDHRDRCDTVLVAVPILLKFIGLNSFASEILRYVRWPALAAVMILALAAVYRYGPHRERAHWKWLTWGSAIATVIWLAASFGFSWYVSAFNSYDKVYGSIGAVVVLLFWFWITAFSGILGAELDNVIERRRGALPK